MLGDDGVLLVPPHPTAALYHNQPLTKPLNAAYTAIFNILGLPITQVPLGLGSWGVPVGVQVILDIYILLCHPSIYEIYRRILF